MDPLASEVLLHSSVGDDLSSNLLLKTPSGSTTAFCPVNINNRHWILLALCSLMKSIKVYDPQGNEHPSVIRKYKIFLGDSAWQVSYPRGSSGLRQSNCFDCGVFVCLYASYLMSNKTFDSTQSDIPAFCTCFFIGDKQLDTPIER